MAIQFTNTFHLKTRQTLPPNWEFWFENIPSGNPDLASHATTIYWGVFIYLYPQLFLRHYVHNTNGIYE
jgi:hypothetical protein